MKSIAITITLILAFLAVNANAAKITSDELNLGRPGSSSDKVINLGPTRFIRSNETTGKLEFSNDGGTIVKEIGSGSGSGDGGGINLLSNSSFEDGSPPQNWTNSGGTFTQETFSNPSSGDEKFARFVATGSGQYIESSLVTVPDDFSFGMMADVRYSSGSSSFDLLILDSTGSVTYSSSSFSDLSDWDKKPTDTFQTPTAGSQIKMRIVSTGAGTIDLNKAYLGSNKGFISSEKSSSYYLTVDSLGNILRESQSGITVNKTGTGLYEIIYSSLNLSSPMSCVSVAHNSASFGNIVDCDVDDSADLTRAVVRCHVDGTTGSATDREFSLTCSKTGSDSASPQETFTPEQSEFFISANIGGDNSSLTVGGPKELTASSWTLDNEYGASQIACSSTEESSGNTCSGNESLGISFNAPVSGRYKVCTTFPLEAGSQDSGAQDSRPGFRLVQTENNSQTVLKEGESVSSHRRESSGVVSGLQSRRVTSYLCSNFIFSNAGKKTIRLFYEVASVSTAYVVIGNRNTDSYEPEINFSVELMSNNVSRPIIQNMVDTKFSSGIRVESCYINDAPTATTASSLCDSWIESLTDSGTGVGFATIKAGIFSQSPVCTFGGQQVFPTHNSTQTTVSRFDWRLNDSGGNNVAGDFHVTCTGAR